MKKVKTVSRNFGIRKMLFIMRITVFIMVLSLMQVSASVYSQVTKLNINVENASLEDILDKIKEQSEFNFLYRSDIFKGIENIDLKFSDVTLETILDKVLVPEGYAYEIEDNVVVIRKEKLAIITHVSDQSQQKTIKGKVTDGDNKPLPGATILEVGTGSNGTITDVEGGFELALKGENAVLRVSFIGFETQEIQVGNKTFIEITLKSSLSSLDEVVVIGYGTSKVKDVTGSISRISTADLEAAPMGATVSSMLQGRASGVNISIQSPSPTSAVSVIIRGQSSLTGNNQPLWVIDGVPNYSIGTDGDVSNTLYNLNLNDLQSIDILKDASATALYGSRGANGVVLVTTKSGVEGSTPVITVSARVGVQQQDFNGYEYMNATEYKKFMARAVIEQVYQTGQFTDAVNYFADQTAFNQLSTTSELSKKNIPFLTGDKGFLDGNTDWIKLMTQNPLTTAQDISVSGGTTNINYYLSLNHSQQTGIIKRGLSEIFGGSLRLEAKVVSGVKLGVNVNGNKRETVTKDLTSNNQSILSNIRTFRPDYPAYQADGKTPYFVPYVINPLVSLLNINDGVGRSLSLTSFLEIDITKELKFKTAFTNSNSTSQTTQYLRRGYLNNTYGDYSAGYRNWTLTDNNTDVWENTLFYVKTFKGHEISALLGYSMEKSSSTDHQMIATNFPDDDVLNSFSDAAKAGTGTETTGMYEGYSANSLMSEFARAHYKFKDRYIVSGTIRRDGSSRFGPDRRWGTFPSGAVAWLINEEKFMKSIEWLSYLKLRASMGKAGSQTIGNYAWRSGINGGQYNQEAVIIPGNMGNPDLQWEESLMTDIALDYGFLKEKIRGTLGVFKKSTDNMMYSNTLPYSSSYTSISSNLASMETKGIEFDVRVDLIKNANTTLTFDFNAAKNETRLVKFNDLVTEVTFSSVMKLEAGGRTNQWWGYKSYGRLYVTEEEVIALQSTVTSAGGWVKYWNAYESIGDLPLKDLNGDGVITTADQTYLGSAEPKLFGGFGMTYRNKGWTINSTFTYAYGNKRLWQEQMQSMNMGGNNQAAKTASASFTSVQNPYTATIPRMTLNNYGGNNTFSDFWLCDASYIRLNALNISYRMPKKLLEKLPIDGIDFSFQATNLFTLTKYPGYDPQGNFSTTTSVGAGMGIDYSRYPSAQTYTFGVKLTFK